MRLLLVLPLVLTAGALATASAQPSPRARIIRPEIAGGRAYAGTLTADDEPYAAIGINTSMSASDRDTLGLLVTSVVEGSPAERAGIEEGNRLVSVNGVNLRINSEDAGAPEMMGIMQRRLTRELRKLKPGDEVELRVYQSGRERTIRVRTGSSDDVFKSERRLSSTRDSEDRPTLGFGIGSTNSRRDTLGVLVMYVNDSGPAARAGIEEGNRIAMINGVDLRVSREDAGDGFIGNTKTARLQREIAKTRVGDDVELRVYQGGGVYRTMHVRTARASDLPRNRSSVFITGDGLTRTMVMPAMPPMPPMRDLDIDGAQIGADVRRAIERAMEATGSSLQGMGRALDGVGRGLGRSHYQFDDDEAIDSEPLTRSAPSRAPAAKTRPQMRTAFAPMEDAIATTVSTVGEVAPAIATAIATTVPELVTAAVEPLRVSYGTPSVAGSAVGVGNDVSLSIAGLRVTPVDDELKSYLGEGSERGLVVTNVPEWARPLRTGDVILRINGKPVRDGDSSVVELGNGKPTFELLRKGKAMTIITKEPR